MSERIEIDPVLAKKAIDLGIDINELVGRELPQAKRKFPFKTTAIAISLLSFALLCALLGRHYVHEKHMPRHVLNAKIIAEQNQTIANLTSKKQEDLRTEREKLAALLDQLMSKTGLEERDQWGRTALFKAMVMGNTDEIEFWVDSGANLNTYRWNTRRLDNEERTVEMISEKGRSALMGAIVSGEIEAAIWFVDMYAERINFEYKNAGGRTALDLCVRLATRNPHWIRLPVLITALKNAGAVVDGDGG